MRTSPGTLFRPFVILCLTAGAAVPAQGVPTFLEQAEYAPVNVPSNNTRIAVSGDTLFVGDWSHGVGGAVLVYEKVGGRWSSSAPAAVLSPANAIPGEFLGDNLAVDGDTLIVGAPHSPRFGGGNGAAFVFEKPAGGWTSTTETLVIGPCCAGSGYTFGSAVAIAGDTLVVGASQGNRGLPFPGAAHVYEKPAGASWSQAVEVARLAPADGLAYESATDVAILGDAVFVAAPGRNRVHVYEKPAGGWVSMSETAVLTPSVGFGGPTFGVSLSAGSGYVAVGGTGCCSNSGAVFVFEEPVSGWVHATETALLTATDAGWTAHLGSSVDCDGDRIASGAPRAPGFPNYWGAVYIFERPAGGWANANEIAKIMPSEGRATPVTVSFGLSVSLDGSNLAVSDYFTSGGTAFVFEDPPRTPGSGCGLGDTVLSGSTRTGGVFGMQVAPCTGGGAAEFILGVPLAQPFSFAPPVSCTGASPCLLSCNPVIRISSPSLTLTWANDPSFVGISLCIQGMCLDTGVPCLELSDMVTITITS